MVVSPSNGAGVEASGRPGLLPIRALLERDKLLDPGDSFWMSRLPSLEARLSRTFSMLESRSSIRSIFFSLQRISNGCECYAGGRDILFLADVNPLALSLLQRRSRGASFGIISHSMGRTGLMSTYLACSLCNLSMGLFYRIGFSLFYMSRTVMVSTGVHKE